MHWFPLALATAVFAASEAAAVKRFLGDLSIWELSAYPMLYSLPLFLLLLPFVAVPELQPGFWSNLLLLLPVNAAGYLCTLRGITLAPLSLTMPFLAFTPVVVLLTGLLLLGEQPTLWGLVGILAVIGGSYVLHLDSAAPHKLLEPFRAVLRERGTRYVLLASVVYGFSAVMGKLLIQQSSALFAGALFFLVHNTLFVLAVLLFRRCNPGRLLARPRAGLLTGALFFLHCFCHFKAIALAPAAYMISVKRLSGLFSVLYGAVVFKEQHIPLRLLGAACMSLGAACIVLFG